MSVPSPLSQAELSELQVAFSDLLNYDNEDPTAPINPLRYHAPDGDTCLHIAALRGNLRAVQLLIKAGLDVNAQGDMGYTPLHYAANAEIVQLLLASGAHENIKNEFGQSAVDWKNS